MPEYSQTLDKESEVFTNLGSHECAISADAKGKLHIRFLDFPNDKGDCVDTVAGALLVENQLNA